MDSDEYFSTSKIQNKYITIRYNELFLMNLFPDINISYMCVSNFQQNSRFSPV